MTTDSGYIGIEKSDALRSARQSATRIKRGIPSQWGAAVDALARRAAGEPVWRSGVAWLERLSEFKNIHGNALAYHLSDFEIGEKAKAMAAAVTEVLAEVGNEAAIK